MGISETTERILETEIHKQVNEFKLDLSFSAGRGCLGILGPSGCGKSMTLKCIAGIIRPDRGKIILNQERNYVFFDGEKKICLPPQKRRVGYLFQNYALFPNMTVEENILIGLEGRRKSSFWQIWCGRRKENRGCGIGNKKYRDYEIENKENKDSIIRNDKSRNSENERKESLRQLIAWFRLEGLEKRYPTQLSGGQQQRTALARIFAYAPDVLLLDEPFSAMDAFLRESLRLELARVLDSFPGISIMVTHDRDEAFQLCSHLLLMDKGQVLAAGETKAVFQNPGSCQAARLTGCKNISRIQRLGKYRVRALDWKGMELTTEKPVGEEIRAIGIRTQDLEEISQGQAEAWKENIRGNLIPVENPVVSEMPFFWQITLENGLWWKKEKTRYTHDAAGVLPNWLRVEPSQILLLEGE